MPRHAPTDNRLPNQATGHARNRARRHTKE